MFAGIQHVAIMVNDLARARHFYEQVLGLAELPRPDFGVPGVWYDLGASQQLHIAEFDGHVAPARQHFALVVEDLDDVAATLEAAGIEVRIAPFTPGAGRQAAIHDPAGNLIELNQPIERSLPTTP